MNWRWRRRLRRRHVNIWHEFQFSILCLFSHFFISIFNFRRNGRRHTVAIHCSFTHNSWIFVDHSCDNRTENRHTFVCVAMCERIARRRSIAFHVCSKCTLVQCRKGFACQWPNGKSASTYYYGRQSLGAHPICAQFDVRARIIIHSFNSFNNKTFLQIHKRKHTLECVTMERDFWWNWFLNLVSNFGCVARPAVDRRYV